MNAIDFKGTMIPVVSDDVGRQWVSVRHVCEALGVDNKAQQRRLGNENFTCGLKATHDTLGRRQELFCIVAEEAHLWVAGISPARLHLDVRKEFLIYRRECSAVLYNHFQQKGEDFLGIAQQLQEFRTEVNKKLDDLRGVADTVFGDDKNEIQTLVEQVSQMYKVDGRTVWGWIQSELDVQSYKRQNRKIINFLKNKLGKGLTLVKEETPGG
jgi:hypothetical protein